MFVFRTYLCFHFFKTLVRTKIFDQQIKMIVVSIITSIIIWPRQLPGSFRMPVKGQVGRADAYGNTT